MVTPYLPGKFVWFDLLTQDIHKAIKFYGGLFGQAVSRCAHGQQRAVIAYGPNRLVMFHDAATFVDKILKGPKPGDLPVAQPTKFELIINMKTAKALGIKISNPNIIALARM